MRLGPVLLLTLVSACGSHELLRVSGAPPPRAPSEASPPAPLALAPAPPPPDTPLPGVARAPFDPSVVVLVLDDPKLAAARELAARGKSLDAAKAIEDALDPSAAPETAARWRYRAALLRKAAGDPKGAALAFEKAAAFDGPLRPFALLEAGELALALNDEAGALGDLAGVDEEAVPRARLGLAKARALVRSGKVDDGLAAYRAITKEHDKGWAPRAAELARALLAHPGEGHALEAARIAVDLDLDAPSHQAEAKKLLDEAKKSLSTADRRALEAPDAAREIDRAKRLLASGRAKQALSVVEARLHAEPEPCEVARVHGEALAALDRAIEASSELEKALTACAATSSDGDTSRLLTEAELTAIRAGDLSRAKDCHDKRAGAKGVSALDVEDSTFAFARELMKRGDWKSAETWLAGLDGASKERSYLRAGRFPYFHGRAWLMLSERDKARAAFERTLRDYPLGYYAALAYARLEEIEPGRGKATLEAALHATPPAPPSGPSDEVTKSAAWRAAVELACEDDVQGVMSALDALGVIERKAAPEVTLAGAELLARTSSPTAAHLLLRTASEYEETPTGRREVYAYRDAFPIGDYRKIWELAYPRPFEAEAERAAKESGIPEALLYAITREESAFEPSAVSKAGAIGLTQVMPATARNGARRLGLPFDDASVRDPGENLRLGAHFLKKMRDDFPDDPILAIPAYNAGPGAPERWAKEHPDAPFDLFVEDIPFTETRSYTKRVISSLFAYEVLYGSLDASEAVRTPAAARSVSPAPLAKVSRSGPP